MKYTLPIWKRTFGLYKRLSDYVTFGTIAKISGVSTDTADDWARPVESDEYPTGSGKRNTTDTVLRQIREAHVNDRGLAHDWAKVFPSYVEYLDEVAGVERQQREPGGSICSVIGESAKEHLDIVLMVMDSPNPDLERLETEIGEAMSKMKELEACVRAERKKQAQIDFHQQAFSNGNGASGRGK